MHFIVEEIDEDTSMEELQKMMLVALVYRILVCFYEVSTHRNSEGCVVSLKLFTENLFWGFTSNPNSPRLCAFGEQEVPPRGSFSSDSESSRVTHQFWFSPTGYLWFRLLTYLCLRECLFFFPLLLLSGYISETFSSIWVQQVIEILVLSPHTGRRSEPWTRTFPLHSFSQPSSRSSSSSTTGLCMIWSLGQSSSSDPGSDDAEVEEKNKLYDNWTETIFFLKYKNAHKTAMFRYHWNVGVFGWESESVRRASVHCDLGLVCLFRTDTNCIPACMSSCCTQYLLLCPNVWLNTGRTMGNTLYYLVLNSCSD